MALVDEDGRLFGVINVVDALVALLVIALVSGGVTLVTGPTTATETVSVTGSATVSQPVADAVTASPAVLDEDVSGVTVTSSTLLNQTQTPHVRVGLTFDMAVLRTQSGALTARNKRLIIGQTYVIDFGTALVDVEVSSINAQAPAGTSQEVIDE